MAYPESESPPTSELEAVKAAVDRITEEYPMVDPSLPLNPLEAYGSSPVLEPAIVGLAQLLVATQESAPANESKLPGIKKVRGYVAATAIGAVLGVAGMVGAWSSSKQETSPKATTLAMSDAAGSAPNQVGVQAGAFEQASNAAQTPHQVMDGKRSQDAHRHAAKHVLHQIKETPHAARAASVQTSITPHSTTSARYGDAPTRSVIHRAPPNTRPSKPQGGIHQTEQPTYHVSPTRSRSTGGASYHVAPATSKAGGTAPSAVRRSQHSVGGGIGAN